MFSTEKEFAWKEGTATVWFNIASTGSKTEAVNIRIEKSSSAIDLPEMPLIVENVNKERIFRSDRINKEEGHTFEYFDNKFSREIISFIDQEIKKLKQ